MQRVFFFSIYLIISLLVTRCATPSSVSGGEGDKTPPKIIKAKPENQQKGISPQTITLKFDSYIKGASYGKELLISPLPTKTPKIKYLNKHLSVSFQEPLKANTTYVISISDVEDAFTNQKMDMSYTYAFSTGDVLDSMKVSGRVIDAQTQAGAKDMTVMLFDVDSVKGNDFFKKRPEYIAKTNSDGAFSFSNLKKKAYKLYAVLDTDKSNTYNQTNEAIAFGKNTTIHFIDSLNNLVHEELISFVPDNMPPAIKGYEWLSDRELGIEVSEQPLLDKLKVEWTDTLGKVKQEIQQVRFYKGEKKYLFLTLPQKRDSIQRFSFQHLTDSLGNARDSILKVTAKKPTKKGNYPLLQKPEYNPNEQAIEIVALSSFLDSLATNFAYLDSVNKKQTFVVQQKEGSLFLRPQEGTKFTNKIEILLKAKYFWGKDSVMKYPFVMPKSTDFGNISGKVKTEGYEGKIILVLQTPKSMGKGSTGNDKPDIIAYDRNFNFQHIKAGKYPVKVIFDEDGNGVWTSGNLQIGKLPEKVFQVASPIEVRGNWDMDEIEIDAPFNKPASSNKEGIMKKTDKPKEK